MKRMRTPILCTLLGFAMISPGIAEHIVQITIGSDQPTSNAHLTKRVYELERAVRFLQDQLNSQAIQQANVIAANSVTCVIETPFKGVFTSTKPSKGEAQGTVMAECSKKADGFMYCSKDKVKCE